MPPMSDTEYRDFVTAGTRADKWPPLAGTVARTSCRCGLSSKATIY
jgi:hypothetical protein